MKMIKTILPVTAILLALVTAFTTTARPDNLAKIKISVRGGLCQHNGYCIEGGSSICTYQNNGTTFLDTYDPGPPAVCAPYSALGVWSVN